MRARLRAIIDQKSLLRGKVMQLSSGATSKYYFDMKPTIFDPEAASLISELILAALANEKVEFLGGLEMGAVPIVACTVQASYRAGRPIRGFFVRKQAKGHGTMRLVEGVAEHDLRGHTAVLLDDVTTSGASVLKAVQAARNQGALVDLVVTVVDRIEGAEQMLARHGLRLVPLLRADEFSL